MGTTTTRARRTGLALLAALVAGTGILAGGPAPAPVGAADGWPDCTTTWTGGNGSWTDPTHWTTGVVPGPTDHVCMGAGGGSGSAPVTATIRATEVTVASLAIGRASTADGQVHVALIPDGAGLTASLTAAEGIMLTPRGSLSLGGTSSTATPGGTVRVAVGPDAELANGGTVMSVDGSGGHTAEIDGLVTNRGLLYVEHDLALDELDTSEEVRLAEATLTTTRFEGSHGTLDGPGLVETTDLRIDFLQMGTVEGGGGVPLVRVTDGQLELYGSGNAYVFVRGDVDMSGSVEPAVHVTVQDRQGQPATLRFAQTLFNRGEIVLAGGDLDGTAPDAVVENEGQIYSTAGVPTITSLIGADVENRGFVGTGEGVLAIEGDVANENLLDLDVGELTIGGDLDLRAAGRLETEVEATDEDAGVVDVAGAATVDGVLGIDTDDPPPAVGSTLDVVTSGSRTGTFADVVFDGPASYDAEYRTEGVRLVRRASESLSYRFVRAAYQDFLGRQPTPAELARDGGAVQAGTLRPGPFLGQLAGSVEYVTQLVEGFYRDTLGRPGDPAGTAYWAGELRSGRQTVAQVAAGFYASAEYIVYQAENRPALWVHRLYGFFFDREPLDGERDYWVARIRSVGYTKVATELFQSLESRRQRVDALYAALLHRESDPAGRDYWAGRIRAEGDLVLAVQLAKSSEYLFRAQARYP